MWGMIWLSSQSSMHGSNDAYENQSLLTQLDFLLTLNKGMRSIKSKSERHLVSWNMFHFNVHCNPLQGNYRVELLHREIPVVIAGNEFTEYSFLLFWLHFFPCFNNIEIVALVPVICTGNCQFIQQGLKGCFNTL